MDKEAQKKARGERFKRLVKALDLSPDRIEAASGGRFTSFWVKNLYKGSVPNVVDGEALLAWLLDFYGKLDSAARLDLSPSLFSAAYVWGNGDSHEGIMAPSAKKCQPEEAAS